MTDLLAVFTVTVTVWQPRISSLTCILTLDPKSASTLASGEYSRLKCRKIVPICVTVEPKRIK